MNKFLKNNIHLIVIIIGSIFLCLGSFHSNVWFDETYTINIINHNFIDLIKIGISDVHPILYYILLKCFSIIFGNSIVILRLFSVIPLVLLSVIGYTHIRKDLGNKAGIIFSFLISFLPVCFSFASEIRMYSLSALFVTLTSIYAYRIAKNKFNITNHILFVIFSISSAYTHHFAMIAIAFINIALFFYIIKYKKSDIKNYILTAIIQIILYIPGLIVFILQATKVSYGFWINIKYPDIIFDILSYNITGSINLKITILLGIVLYIYLIISTIKEYIKNKKELIYPILNFGIYIFIVILALTYSHFISDIFVVRYMFPMIGLFTIYFSYLLSKENNALLIIILSSITILSLYNCNIVIKEHYNVNNHNITKVIQNDLKENDIFVYSDIKIGSIIATYFPKNKQYFLNLEKWDIEQPYKAYLPVMECRRDFNIKNINNDINNDINKNRIWIVDNNNLNIYNKIKDIDNIKIIKDKQEIKMPYKDHTFILSLIEKK